MNTKERVYAQINLDALSHNYRRIRNLCAEHTKILASVKADAYGHGAIPVSERLIADGVDYLAVACYAEGAEIRNAFPHIPILVLGYLTAEELPLAVSQNLTITVYDEQIAKAVSKAAVALGKTAKVHIKLDSGMTRLGFSCGSEAVSQIRMISDLPALEIEGIFTHFAVSDTDEAYTRAQFSAFMQVCDGLENAGVHILIRHACNSAAIERYPEMHLDMVRVGIALYAPDTPEQEGDVRSVMTLYATVAAVREVRKGTDIGYGRTFTVTRDSKIAVLTVGYADGYFRSLSNRVTVSIWGRPAPIVGRICMDQCMVDVTDLPEIKIGTPVIIFGEAGETVMGARGLAEQIGTISYEVLCNVSKRVPRRYTEV